MAACSTTTKDKDDNALKEDCAKEEQEDDKDRVKIISSRLIPIAKAKGKDFCVYELGYEEGRVIESTTRAKIIPSYLQKHYDIYDATKDLLPLRPAETSEAMCIIFDQFYNEWKIKAEHRDSYKTMMATRVRVISSKLSKELAKKNPSGWAKLLTTHVKPEASPIADPDVVEAPPTALTEKSPSASAKNEVPVDSPNSGYYYSWKRDLNLAVRLSTSTGAKKRKREEPSLPIDLNSDHKDDDYVTAVWMDGSKREMPGITYGMLRGEEKRKTQKQNDKLFTTTHKETHHEIFIKQKTDHVLLLTINEQNKILGYVRVDRFGPLPEPQPHTVESDNATLKLAVAFATPIAEAFANGSLKDASEVTPAINQKYLDERIPKVKPKARAKAKGSGSRNTDTSTHAETESNKAEATMKPEVVQTSAARRRVTSKRSPTDVGNDKAEVGHPTSSASAASQAAPSNAPKGKATTSMPPFPTKTLSDWWREFEQIEISDSDS